MIILTGAAGFIGSQIAERLGQHHRLILVDRPEHFRNRGYVDSGETTLVDWAHGQDNRESRHKILDREYFPKILQKIHRDDEVLVPKGEKIEWVIHLGACTDTAETRKDFLDTWNVEFSKSIWNWCAQEKVPLIYASSGATYGNGELGFSDSWETALQLKPMNPYGQSKQDFDLWVHEQIHAKKMPPYWYGLKFFNVYGPHEGHKGPMASAVLHSFRHIQRTGSCKLFRSAKSDVKDGEQSRDFIHVDDIANIIDFMMDKKPKSALYNCGTGKARTFYSMMEALFAALDKPIKVDWIDTPEQYKKAYQYFTEADMSRLLAVGYDRPFKSLEDGVASYVEWLSEHDLRPLSKNIH